MLPFDALFSFDVCPGGVEKDGIGGFCTTLVAGIFPLISLPVGVGSEVASGAGSDAGNEAGGGCIGAVSTFCFLLLESEWSPLLDSDVGDFRFVEGNGGTLTPIVDEDDAFAPLPSVLNIPLCASKASALGKFVEIGPPLGTFNSSSMFIGTASFILVEGSCAVSGEWTVGMDSSVGRAGPVFAALFVSVFVFSSPLSSEDCTATIVLAITIGLATIGVLDSASID